QISSGKNYHLIPPPICDIRLSVTRQAAHSKFVWFSTPTTMLETFIITLNRLLIELINRYSTNYLSIHFHVNQYPT
ncbi:unnamed protein product, partial [Tenebrio molitor]